MKIKKLNESFALIIAEENILFFIDNLYSCFMTGYKFNQKYIDGFWDGKFHFFEVKYNRIPIGLIPDLILKIKKKFKNEKIENDIVFELQKKPDKNYYNKLKLKPPFEIRDYQKKAFESAIINANVVLKAATGAGKSLIIYLILDYYIKLGKKILVKVPQIQLVQQLFEDFKDYNSFNIEIGLSTKNKKLTKKELNDENFLNELDKDVVIATWQTLQHQESSYFEKFDVVIMDEVHSINGEVVQKIIQKCKNATSKIGLTGTLKQDKYSEFSILANFFKIDLIITPRQLIDMGYASEVKIYPVELKHNVDNFKIFDSKKLLKVEESYVNNSKSRLNFIADFISNTFNKMKYNNSLILYKTIKDGFFEDLKLKMIEVTGRKDRVFVINGKTKLKDRQLAVKCLEENDGVIIIASFSTFSTGINAKNINNIFFVESYSSMVKITQSIGRGVRQHKNKKHVNIFDFYDKFNFKNRLHMQHLGRLNIYKELEYLVFKKLDILIKEN